MDVVEAPVEELAAREAGLRYVTPGGRGIRRLRHGAGFRYVEPDGAPVSDEVALKRIRSLAIPPAWEHVWICPDPRGHIQATGRDARGRRQYRYHPRWRETRDSAKFEHLLEFGQALPRIRERVAADLGLTGLPREKVLAALVSLLDRTLVRVGNDEYARANGSFGLTTLRNRHARVNGAEVRLSFRGKSGREHRVGLRDRRLASVVRRCQQLPGQLLFEYTAEDGGVHSVDSGDVNDYLRECAGTPVTAREFRTWAGSVLAAAALAAAPVPSSIAQGKHLISRAVELVSAELRNTPSVCRKSYIHPRVFEAYTEGWLGECFRGGARKGLSSEEAALMRLLQRGQ